MNVPAHRVNSSLSRKRWHPWYEKIAEAILARLGRFSLRELAEELGCHPNTLTRVLRSDAWREFWAEYNRDRKEKIDARLVELAHRSLSQLMERIEREETPVGEVRESAALALKALGFLGDRGAGPAVQVNVSPALAEARARIIEARFARAEEQDDAEEQETPTAPRAPVREAGP